MNRPPKDSKLPADSITHDGTNGSRRGPLRILIVGGDPDVRAALVERLQRHEHGCSHVNRLDEARVALARGRHDVLLLNPDLPDGDGLDLARHLQRTAAGTRTIVFSDIGSFSSALRALHCGAIDYIRTPIDLEEFVQRVNAAVTRSRHEQTNEQRIERLRTICRQLSSARDEVTDQVDTLCQDLAAAYRELGDRVSEATMTSEFRTLIQQELDLEEVLRTTLEYLLGKIGPTNAAVFLPDGDGVYCLGAYVNYDCPRESIDALLDHLCEAICPQMSAEGELVSFADAGEFADWVGLEEGLLQDTQVIAFSCHHGGECLAVVVLFRSQSMPFEPELAATLDLLRSIFAEHLARLMRIHHRAAPSWPQDAHDDDGYDEFGFGLGGGMAA